MAMETPKIRADVVEAQEFPHLAQQYGVRAVPKTVINNTVEVLGSVPESVLLHRLLAVAGREDLLEEFGQPQSEGVPGGPTTMVEQR